MLRKLIDHLEKRRMRGFLNSIQNWYQLSKAVSDLCEDALYDPEVCSDEIGIIVDQADNSLFGLRNEEAECFRYLKSYNIDLANRHKKLSENLFRLRNETVRFLIRCQGPGPAVINQYENKDHHKLYYYQALDEVGFEARRLRSQVNTDLQAIWEELQSVIQQVELRTAA